jgi:hypothetical protein
MTAWLHDMILPRPDSRRICRAPPLEIPDMTVAYHRKAGALGQSI